MSQLITNRLLTIISNNPDITTLVFLILALTLGEASAGPHNTSTQRLQKLRYSGLSGYEVPWLIFDELKVVCMREVQVMMSCQNFVIEM